VVWVGVGVGVAVVVAVVVVVAFAFGVKMKKIHLGVDCFPYKNAWYVYCRVELVEDFENWQLTEEPKEATCKRCLALFEKISEGMDAALKES